MSFQGENRRRYPRLFVGLGHDFKKIVGADAVWTTGEQSAVLDLSYHGAALVPPKDQELGRDQLIQFTLVLKGSQALPIDARVVRIDDKSLAVEFTALNTEARRSLGKFLDDKLIGFHLKQIPQERFGRGQDFQFWFHGPNNTNLFLWGSRSQVDKAIFELGNATIHWDGIKLTQGKSHEDLEEATEDYAQRILNEKARESINKDTPLLVRAIDVLSQAEKEYPVLSHFIKILNERSLQ